MRVCSQYDGQIQVKQSGMLGDISIQCSESTYISSSFFTTQVFNSAASSSEMIILRNQKVTLKRDWCMDDLNKSQSLKG